MSVTLSIRQQLIETVEELPTDLLPEVAAFFEYLRFRASAVAVDTTTNEQQAESGSAFLRAITGLGSSAEGDVSTRDEEILASELDPIRGWTVTGEN